MGVKDLWSILDPISEEITLEHLRGKKVAIDLSGWVCDSQAIGQSHRSIQRPDMRNTFFRASRLVLSNVYPIFVLEGEAPKIKHSTIQHRNATQRPWQTSSTQTKNPRAQFNSKLKPMIRLLDAMGLSYCRSTGEAEKMCAFLNKEKVVDAVISQDSDCLLYGASEVLRHFSVAKGSATAKRYCASRVHNELQLDRERLVVLALLLGCDYGQRGVHGVGREQAITYLKGLTGSPLQRLRSWRHDSYLAQLERERIEMSQARSCPSCWHLGTERKHSTNGCPLCFTSTGCTARHSLLQGRDERSQWQLLELQIRAKALQDLNFPSEEIIQEFLKEEKLCTQVKVEWKEPNIQKLLDIGTQQLGWERCDCLDKVLQLVSRWQCFQLSNRLPCGSMPLQLSHIVKLRVQHGERCAEVQWLPRTELGMQIPATTLEPLTIFTEAYSAVWEEFEQEQLALKSRKKARKDKAPVKKAADMLSCGSVDLLGEMMEQLELDESIAEHELSDIVMSIVSRSTMN